MMGTRKWTPEEREAFRRQRAEWDQECKNFVAMHERLRARWRAEDERRERRRQLLSRLLPFRRAAQRGNRGRAKPPSSSRRIVFSKAVAQARDLARVESRGLQVAADAAVLAVELLEDVPHH